jgi:hypothetical protein
MDARSKAIVALAGKTCPHQLVEGLSVNVVTGEQRRAVGNPPAASCRVCVDEEVRYVGLQDEIVALKSANDLLQEQLETGNNRLRKHDHTLAKHADSLAKILEALRA